MMSTFLIKSLFFTVICVFIFIYMRMHPIQIGNVDLTEENKRNFKRKSYIFLAYTSIFAICLYYWFLAIWNAPTRWYINVICGVLAIACSLVICLFSAFKIEKEKDNTRNNADKNIINIGDSGYFLKEIGEDLWLGILDEKGVKVIVYTLVEDRDKIKGGESFIISTIEENKIMVTVDKNAW